MERVSSAVPSGQPQTGLLHHQALAERAKLRNFACNYAASSTKQLLEGVGLLLASVVDSSQSSSTIGLFQVSLERIEKTPGEIVIATNETVRDLAWSPINVEKSELLAVVTDSRVFVFRVTSGSPPCKSAHEIELGLEGPPVTSVEWTASAIPSLVLFCSTGATRELVLPRAGKVHRLSVLFETRGIGLLLDGPSDRGVWTSPSVLSWAKSTKLLANSTDNVNILSLAKCGKSGCAVALAVSKPLPLIVNADDQDLRLILPNRGTGITKEGVKGVGPLICDISTTFNKKQNSAAELGESTAVHETVPYTTLPKRTAAFPHALPGTSLLEALRADVSQTPPCLALTNCVSRPDQVFLLLRNSDESGMKITIPPNFQMPDGRMDVLALAIGTSRGVVCVSSTVGGGDIVAISFNLSRTSQDVQCCRYTLPDSLRCRGLLVWPCNTSGSSCAMAPADSSPLLVVLSSARSVEARSLASTSASSTGPLILLQYRLPYCLDSTTSPSSPPPAPLQECVTVATATATGTSRTTFEAQCLHIFASIEAQLSDQSRLIRELSVKIDGLSDRVGGLEKAANHV